MSGVGAGASAASTTVVRLASVDSTQRYAAELAGAGAVDGTAVVTDTQTAGKGRRGRTWQDIPGASLLVSIIVRSPLPLVRTPTLSLAAGVAVAEALAAVGVTDARLKWPNDVLVGGRKIAGILLERHGDAIILGIGANVHASAVPDALATPATSVAAEGGVADREALLEAVRASFARWRGHLERDGFEPVRRRWTELAAALGTPVTADGVTGTALGLDVDGALLIATEAGTTRVVAGDVILG